jgi:hypothetical protein
MSRYAVAIARLDQPQGDLRHFEVVAVETPGNRFPGDLEADAFHVRDEWYGVLDTESMHFEMWGAHSRALARVRKSVCQLNRGRSEYFSPWARPPSGNVEFTLAEGVTL